MSTKLLISFGAIIGLTMGVCSHTALATDFAGFKARVFSQKAIIDKAIRSVRGVRPFENDDIAGPIYIEASNDAMRVGEFAENAIRDPAKSYFYFSKMCVTTGLMRMKVARANLAAAQPPIGDFIAFGQELGEVVVGLQKIRNDYACP